METVMSTPSEEAPIPGIELSVDGKRNMFSMHCGVTEQIMSYAACNWRLDVLKTPNVKTPADWEKCRTACKTGACVVVGMREQELLLGRSIHFQDRHAGRSTQVARHLPSAWSVAITKGPGQTSVAPVRSAPPPKARPASVLDAMGDTGDFAAAITAAAVERPVTPPPAPTPMPTPTVAPPRVPETPAPAAPRPTAMPGESPLQMARRIAAERQALASLSTST